MLILAPSQRVFVGASTLLFAASAGLTIAWCGSMSAMHAMPMPGGWTMSMMWMRMPGQTWPDAATAFLGMWCVMMTAMMLPSLVPMLARYRRVAAATSPARLDGLTALVGSAYFFVWAVFGMIAYAIGMMLASLAMEFPPLARAAPMTSGALVLIAGGLQYTAWKARHLACCRGMPSCCNTLAADIRSAWRYGLQLGVHCVHCCFGLTIVLLVVGVMDLCAMAIVTAAISAERLVPGGTGTARLIGVALIVAGLLQILNAAAVLIAYAG